MASLKTSPTPPQRLYRYKITAPDGGTRQMAAANTQSAPAAEPQAGEDVKLTRGERWLAAFAAIGGLTSSACGYITNFDSLTAYATAKHWVVPQALPIGLDAAIPTLLVFDYIVTRKGANFPYLRWCAWSLTAFTVGAGAIAAAAKGHNVDWGNVLLKAIMAALGVILVEAVRKWALYKKNLVEKKQRDSIPLARWFASPFRTPWMKRQMVLWDEKSYPRAIAREAALLYAKSLLQTRYGKRAWKSEVPLSLRYRLKRGQLPTSVVEAIKTSVEYENEDWQPAVERWITTELWRVQSMFGDRDSGRRADEVSDRDQNPGRSLPSNRDREIGDRTRRSSRTGNRTKRTARPENRTAASDSETGGSRRVGRPPRSEAEEAQLRADASAFFARSIQETGKPPRTDDLRDELKIGKEKALALLRDLKQDGPEMPPTDEAPELVLLGGENRA